MQTLSSRLPVLPGCNWQKNSGATKDCRTGAADILQLAGLKRLSFGPCDQEDQTIQLWFGMFPVNLRVLGSPPPSSKRFMAAMTPKPGRHADMSGFLANWLLGLLHSIVA